MERGGYTTEEVARLGRALYEQQIREKAERERASKFVVVDITTGEYEVGEDDLEASDQALAKNPEAILYGIRVGEPAAYRLGADRRFVESDPSWR
jgi:hypothetical protein